MKMTSHIFEISIYYITVAKSTSRNRLFVFFPTFFLFHSIYCDDGTFDSLDDGLAQSYNIPAAHEQLNVLARPKKLYKRIS